MTTTDPTDPGSSRSPETFVEQGAAFMAIVDAADADRRRALDRPAREAFDVIVVGAGQAGLSVGYHLARRGLRFVIVDAGARIGDSWRRRWDSLRLFTTARFDGLDGMPFPGPPDHFPTKGEMADYLEAYAARFQLPVRLGARVTRLWREDGRYVVAAGDVELEADQVVVAMADLQRGRLPAFAAELDPAIVQLHACDYRSPSQLRDGAVLVVGAGNSGAEIALELSRSRRVWLSGRSTGQVPFRIGGLVARFLLARLLLRVVFHRILTVRNPLARRVRAKLTTHGHPLIRVRARQLVDAGVAAVPRTAGVDAGRPRLEDGRVLDVASVVWCTGFEPGFSWIDLPIFDGDGRPRHRAGVADGAPGLYFVGLTFLYAASSVMIHGVGRDARRIADAIAAHRAAALPHSAARRRQPGAARPTTSA